MDYITELYCLVDDFSGNPSKKIDNYMISDDSKHRNRQSILSLSEMTTLVILFHSMKFRQFKKFYQYINMFMRREFPHLLSYNRFIELMPRWPFAIIFVSVVIKCLTDTPNGVVVPVDDITELHCLVDDFC